MPILRQAALTTQVLGQQQALAIPHEMRGAARGVGGKGTSQSHDMNFKTYQAPCGSLLGEVEDRLEDWEADADLGEGGGGEGRVTGARGDEDSGRHCTAREAPGTRAGAVCPFSQILQKRLPITPPIE